MAGGILERRQYHERPPRFEYVLTEKGRDLRPVLLTLFAWGTKYDPPPHVTVRLVDQTTGKAVSSSRSSMRKPESASARITSSCARQPPRKKGHAAHQHLPLSRNR